MTKDELNEVLRLHSMWLRGEAGGVRAIFTSSDLTDADISGIDLRGAGLTNVVLTDTDLTSVILADVYLLGVIMPKGWTP